MAFALLANQKYQPEKPLFSNFDLRKLIIPIIIEQTLAMTVGMIDTMMVSTVGEAAISGVSLVDMISVLINSVFAALATGGAVVISQYLGAKMREKADNSASQLMLLSTLLGVVVGGLCLVFAHVIMANLYGAIDAEVYEAGLLYLRVSAVSYPFLAIYNSGAAIFRSIGNSKISMKVSLLMNVINVFGNAFCLFVLDLGILGVAIPTALSRIFAAIVMLYCTTRYGGVLRVVPTIKLDTQLDLRIMRIALPSAFENCLFQGGRVMVVSMIATFGTMQITAHTVANNLCGIACIPGASFAIAIVTIIGRAVGANDTKQVIYYTKKMMFWVYSIAGVWSLFIILTSPILLNFYTLTAQTSALATQLIYIHVGMGILLWPASFSFPNALRAASDVRFTMIVAIASMLFARIGMSYVLCLQLGLGAIGVYWAMVLDWLVRVIFFMWRFASGKWKNKYISDNR